MNFDQCQQFALESNVRIIEAGPGAGKTYTIVERFTRRSNESSSGIALISFTNIAAEEARRRSTVSVLKYPNYVGTIDSFLNRYIVTPLYIRQYSRRPQYVRSWNEIKNSELVVAKRKEKREPISLDSFSWVCENGELILSISDDNQAQGRTYSRHLYESDKENLCKMAQQKFFSYEKKGILSSRLARKIAYENLLNSSSWGNLIAARFGEIIIDEFQDCSSLEIGIFKLLEESGVHITSVADPYQNIYEFRGVHSSDYRQYCSDVVSAYGDECRVLLNYNYRSGRKICKFISGLRKGANNSIVANGNNDEDDLLILIGSPKEQSQMFKDTLAERSIDTKKTIILAHSSSRACDLSGERKVADSREKGSRSLKGILYGLLLWKSNSDSKTRSTSMKNVISAIVNCYNWENDESLSDDEKLIKLGTSCGEIRLMILKLIDCLSLRDGQLHHKALSERIQDDLRRLLKNHDSLSSKTIPQLFRSPSEREWNKWKSQYFAPSEEIVAPCSHIHGVKGEEYDAVLLSSGYARQKPVWEVWESCHSALDDEAESLRTFYVGASRAKYLLAIGVDSKDEGAFLDWLSKMSLIEGVDFCKKKLMHSKSSEAIQGVLEGV